MNILLLVVFSSTIAFAWSDAFYPPNFFLRGPVSKATIYGVDGSKITSVADAGSISSKGIVGPTFSAQNSAQFKQSENSSGASSPSCSDSGACGSDSVAAEADSAQYNPSIAQVPTDAANGYNSQSSVNIQGPWMTSSIKGPGSAGADCNNDSSKGSATYGSSANFEYSNSENSSVPEGSASSLLSNADETLTEAHGNEASGSSINESGALEYNSQKHQYTVFPFSSNTNSGSFGGSTLYHSSSSVSGNLNQKPDNLENNQAVEDHKEHHGGYHYNNPNLSSTSLLASIHSTAGSENTDKVQNTNHALTSNSSPGNYASSSVQSSSSLHGVLKDSQALHDYNQFSGSSGSTQALPSLTTATHVRSINSDNVDKQNHAHPQIYVSSSFAPAIYEKPDKSIGNSHSITSSSSVYKQPEYSSTSYSSNAGGSDFGNSHPQSENGGYDSSSRIRSPVESGSEEVISTFPHSSPKDSTVSSSFAPATYEQPDKSTENQGYSHTITPSSSVYKQPQYSSSSYSSNGAGTNFGNSHPQSEKGGYGSSSKFTSAVYSGSQEGIGTSPHTNDIPKDSAPSTSFAPATYEQPDKSIENRGYSHPSTSSSSIYKQPQYSSSSYTSNGVASDFVNSQPQSEKIGYDSTSRFSSAVYSGSQEGTRNLPSTDDSSKGTTTNNQGYHGLSSFAPATYSQSNAVNNYPSGFGIGSTGNEISSAQYHKDGTPNSNYDCYVIKFPISTYAYVVPNEYSVFLKKLLAQSATAGPGFVHHDKHHHQHNTY